MLAGIDTGETTGLVLVDEAGVVRERLSTTELPRIYAVLASHTVDAVILERAAPTQLEYQTVRLALSLYGFTVFEISPGEWKPNPQCRTKAEDTPGWTPHERDAYSLVKYYRLRIEGIQRALDEIQREIADEE